MKTLAIGALLLSLTAGSVAMAGQGYAGHAARTADHDRSGHREHGDRNGRGDRGNRNDNHWRNDHHDDHRNDGRRNDWNNNHRNDRRDDHHRNDWNNNHRNDGWRDDHRRHDWNDHRNDRPHYDWNRGRGYDHRYNDWSRPRYSVGVYHRPWGWYDHRWVHGERLPRAYYAGPYIIHDYYACGLRRPPYGYHWVRVDGDAVLALIATGIIIDVIYNQFY